MTLPRLALFASGDFACNLYWQSLSFFLLFFYTDVLRLPAATAGVLFAAGSVWDGIADAVVGAWVERHHRYRAAMGWGAVPLGMSFTLLFCVPPVAPAWLAAAALAIHMAFRTLYALVNIPFAALSARVTQDSRERATIAALRMIFGTGAAILVALVTRALASTDGGAVRHAHGYLVAAALFAGVGTALLLLVARTAPADRGADTLLPEPLPLRSALATLIRNGAFVSLNLAAAATCLANAVLGGAILYYFTYVTHDPHAGPAAVAWMGLTGLVAVPLWTALRNRIGTRALWLADTALALAVAVLFAALGGRGTRSAEIYLVAMQAVTIGFAFCFWAMLPDTVEWGEHARGVRVEALAFGTAALVQKLALGGATAMLGLMFASGGYVADAVQSPASIAMIRAAILYVPAGAIALSALAMALNPLRRDTHARLVAELAGRRAAARPSPAQLAGAASS